MFYQNSCLISLWRVFHFHVVCGRFLSIRSNGDIFVIREHFPSFIRHLYASVQSNGACNILQECVGRVIE